MERIFQFMEAQGLRVVEWYHDENYHAVVVVTMAGTPFEQHLTVQEGMAMEDLKQAVQRAMKRLTLHCEF